MGDEKSNYKQENKKIQNISSIESCLLALLTVVPNHCVNELIEIRTNII